MDIARAWVALECSKPLVKINRSEIAEYICTMANSEWQRSSNYNIIVCLPMVSIPSFEKGIIQTGVSTSLKHLWKVRRGGEGR